MSYSAPQSKVTSPVRTPRSSISGERPAHPANKPAGIINMGMTCFLNSTFQSLAATPALIALLSHNPALPLHPVPGSPLPTPVQSTDATPCLRADSLEPPLYALLPVSRQFTNALHRAWTMKDNGGGTAGPGESSSRHSLTLRSLLKELARKYDQYDEFAQQDAHELLRHLLDSMQMEEKDVIKRIRQDRGGLSAPVTPAAGGTPGTPTTPGSAASVPAAMSASAPLEGAGSLGLTAAPAADVDLVPFVDALFGGLLASVVVCETCKSVSHTYEGFLDISVGMRGDSDVPPQRKRDRFRAMASRLKPRHKLDKEQHATMSEPEGSDSEHGRKRHGHGNGLGLGKPPQPCMPPPPLSPSAGIAGPVPGASDAESDGAGLSRSGSKLGGRVRPSFSFRRKEKGARSASGGSKSSPASSPGLESTGKLEYAPVPSQTDSGPPTPRPASPNPEHHPPNPHHHTAAPTPAQAAYIQRILYGPPGPPEANDPLAKLKAAHAGVAVQPKDYGLIDALKNFTAVEVLEGDNAFACHKCWKIKTGRYARRQERQRQAQLAKGAAAANGNGDLPSIAVENTDTSNGVVASPRAGRLQPRSPGLVRAPSPLRQMVERRPSQGASGAHATSDEDNAPTPTPPMSSLTSVTSALSVDSAMSAGTTATSATTATTGTSSSSSSPYPRADDDSDGLSDSSSDSDDSGDDGDEPPPDLAQRRGFFGQNLQRTQSRTKHFVLRKAFKRYLIAKAPEVLVFHIKRFKQTTSGIYATFSSLKKLDDFVSFPETLDLGPFMAPNRNDFKVVSTPQGPRAPYQDWPSPEQCPEPTPLPYRLYAVVVHLGTMVGGHYIAYVLVDPERMFAAPNDPGMAEYIERLQLEDAEADGGGAAAAHQKDRRVWCYCSDTEIRLASVDEVLAARAYLCFYEKV